MKELKFKIINGIPENHSIDIYSRNKVYIKVTYKDKLAKMDFVCDRVSFGSSLLFYMGVLTGKLIDDIHSANCSVLITIEEI